MATDLAADLATDLATDLAAAPTPANKGPDLGVLAGIPAVSAETQEEGPVVVEAKSYLAVRWVAPAALDTIAAAAGRHAVAEPPGSEWVEAGPVPDAALQAGAA